MKHKETYHLSDEVHTPYFHEKHRTLIHKQCLNTVILVIWVYTSITSDQNVLSQKVNKLLITSIDLYHHKKPLHQWRIH